MPDPFTDGEGEIQRAEHISPRKTGDNISAKRLATYVWNPTGIDINGDPNGGWERMTQPGSSPASKVLIDKATTDIIYIGSAPIGTSTGSGSWQIKKVDKTVADNVAITYAASGAFTATWTNRASETYS